jgi:hypothetical protein
MGHRSTTSRSRRNLACRAHHTDGRAERGHRVCRSAERRAREEARGCDVACPYTDEEKVDYRYEVYAHGGVRRHWARRSWPRGTPRVRTTAQHHAVGDAGAIHATGARSRSTCACAGPHGSIHAATTWQHACATPSRVAVAWALRARPDGGTAIATYVYPGHVPLASQGGEGYGKLCYVARV